MCAAASLLVLVAALCAPVSAAEKPFAELVPADVASFGSLPDYPAVMEKLKATPYYKLFNEPEVKQLIDDVAGLLSEQLKELKALQDEVGVTLDELAGVPKGEIAFATMLKDLQLMPMMGGGKAKQSMLLLADVGDNPAEAEALVNRILERTAQEENVELTEETFQGHRIRCLALQAGGGPAMSEEQLAQLDPELQAMMREMQQQGGVGASLYVSLEDSILAVAFAEDRGLLDAHLTLRDGGEARPLSESDLFQQAMDGVAPDSDYVAFQSFQPQWQAVRQAGAGLAQMGMPDVGAILESLGVFSLKAQGSAAKLAADGISGEALMLIPAPRKGIMKAFEPADTANVKPPAFVGVDAALYIGAYFDVATFWNELRQVIAQFAPPEALAEFDNPAAAPGMVQDLLLGMGENTYLYVPGDVVTSTPEVMSLHLVLAVEVKNAAQSQATLDTILGTMPPEDPPLQKVDFMGQTLYRTPPITLPIPGMFQGLEPFSVLFAGDKMVLATSEAMCRQVIEGSRLPSSPLLEKPDLLASLKHLQKQPDVIAYADQRRIGSWAHALAKRFVPPDMLAIPPYDNIGKYLSSSTTTGKWTDEGFLFKSWQPHARVE